MEDARYCSNCRWWTKAEIANRLEIFGECRYWAPLGQLQCLKDTELWRWHWPMTEGSEWCSFHCRRPRAVPELRKALVVLESVGCGLEVE